MRYVALLLTAALATWCWWGFFTEGYDSNTGVMAVLNTACAWLWARYILQERNTARQLKGEH